MRSLKRENAAKSGVLAINKATRGQPSTGFVRSFVTSFSASLLLLELLELLVRLVVCGATPILGVTWLELGLIAVRDKSES